MNWRPSFLVSYVNLPAVARGGVLPLCDEWVLDSGAYSAATSGVKIDLQRYIDDCLALQQSSKPPCRIFALDVIGDPEKSARNAEEMKRQKIDAVSTFHYGSPWHYLPDVAKTGRMAFGGMVQRGKGGHGTKLQVHQRLRFLEECFSRIWPVWSHGFGCCDPKILSRFPLASADSTTWIYGLQRYGHMQYLKMNNPGLRESTNKEVFGSAVAGQIEFYKSMETKTQERWAPLLRKKNYGPFRLRFVVSSKADKKRFETYLGRTPQCAPS
jgi:hypothetical protein